MLVDRAQFDQRAFGTNWRQFLPLLLTEQGCGADPAAVAARKVEHYSGAVADIRFNEALVFLLRNRSADTRAALVTSASAANVHAALASRDDLRRLFEVVVTGDDVTRHKPDPQSYAIAGKLLGVEPAQCLVFEDSDAGVAAGLAFGARVLKICF